MGVRAAQYIGFVVRNSLAPVSRAGIESVGRTNRLITRKRGRRSPSYLEMMVHNKAKARGYGDEGEIDVLDWGRRDAPTRPCPHPSPRRLTKASQYSQQTNRMSMLLDLVMSCSSDFMHASDLPECHLLPAKRPDGREERYSGLMWFDVVRPAFSNTTVVDHEAI